jgi:hypothetical protein
VNRPASIRPIFTLPPLALNVAAALALAIAATPAARAGDDVEAVKSAVRSTFKAYQQALLKRDGPAAAAVVDRGTIDYYQRMRDLAVGGKAEVVKKLALLDKLMVIRMRHQIPLARLKAMDGKAALAHAVTQGWVGDDVAKVEAGEVEITGERATVAFVVEGKPTPIKLGLWREPAGWRVDLVSLFRLGGAVFRQQQEASGKSEDDFVLTLVRRLSGKRVPATIWNPPR